jgi:hypothetical protein
LLQGRCNSDEYTTANADVDALCCGAHCTADNAADVAEEKEVSPTENVTQTSN